MLKLFCANMSNSFTENVRYYVFTVLHVFNIVQIRVIVLHAFTLVHIIEFQPVLEIAVHLAVADDVFDGVF